MNPRLRLAFIFLALLCAANVAWRIWTGWGRITINADDAPVAEVVRSIQKQGGIQLRSNLPADAKVTMHVKKVPLLHALEVLAANTETSWSVVYFTAADKGSIDTALAALAGGGREIEGWKRFGFGGGGLGLISRGLIRLLGHRLGGLLHGRSGRGARAHQLLSQCQRGGEGDQLGAIALDPLDRPARRQSAGEHDVGHLMARADVD